MKIPLRDVVMLPVRLVALAFVVAVSVFLCLWFAVIFVGFSLRKYAVLLFSSRLGTKARE